MSCMTRWGASGQSSNGWWATRKAARRSACPFSCWSLAVGCRRLMTGNSWLRDLQPLHQLGFEPDAVVAVAQVAAADQENVFGALAERGDLGGLQVGVMLGQGIGHRVQQAWTVGCDQ